MPFQGTTVRIKNTLTDYDESPLTPDSQSIEFYDPEGTKLAGGPFTPEIEAEGVYYLDHPIASDAIQVSLPATTTHSKPKYFDARPEVMRLA